MTNDREDGEALLAHAGWVRALAQHLTRDPHAADDLVQDTLAAALVQEAPPDRPLRRWLGGIVRNLSRQHRRGNRRRRAREQLVAGAAEIAAADSAVLLEQLELHRTVVEAVAQLDEPYRATVLLRYFQDLSPTEIAARTAVPLRTVHTRLRRALVKLRAELDRRHAGDRRAWFLPMLSYACGPRGAATAIGVGFMKYQVTAAVAAIVLVGLGSAFLVPRRDDPAPSREQVGSTATAEPTRFAGSAADEAAAPASRTVADVAVNRPANPPTPRLRGRVIDADAQPVAGVTVRQLTAGRAAVAEAVSDAGGNFELPADGGPGRLDVATPGWATILAPAVPASTGGEPVLVVGRAVALAGVVVDDRGVPVAEANVAVPMPIGWRARFATILDACSTVERSTRTGSDGTFTLADVPLVEGAQLVTTCAPHVADERAVPRHGDQAMLIVLRDAGRDGSRCIGRVVDLAGLPVAGAWVGCGGDATRSSSAGLFALDGTPGPSVVRAVKAGLLPAELASADGTWPDPLVLRMGGSSLSIRGTVVGSDGNTLAGAEVWIADEADFGYIAIEGGEMKMRAGATIEGILRDDPWTRQVLSDRNGSFELRGLLARDYRVHALDRRHLQVATVTVAAGSTGVELRVPHEERWARIAGTVVDRSGAPLAGLPVFLERKRDGIAGLGPQPLLGKSVRSGADGRFEFADVSRAAVAVHVRGESAGRIDATLAIAPGADLEQLRVVVPALVNVQVDAGPGRDFSLVAVLDAGGNRLELTIHHGTSSYASREVVLHEGRSEPFTVSDAGTTLLLLRKDVEVGRVPVQFTGGSLNTVRP
jgi:RNA polymerase sigma-70 factor (ECF subfamily)